MMMMEGEDDVVVCKDPLQIIKGKRSKRPRPPSPPLPLQVASTTTTTTTSTGGDGGVVSATTSVELAEGYSTEREQEVEEDMANMANCLLLLSQGQTRKPPSDPPSSAAVMFVHQCKTCNRCFPSFQVLGGHRASHKKPKVNDHHEDNHKELMFGKDDDYYDELNYMSTTLSLQITSKASVSSNKSRVHECSICGAEFSSGQALGGHMRRHKTLSNNVPTTTNLNAVGTTELPDKPRSVLQLDLNLPAPEDDPHKEPKLLSFSSKGKLLLFSSSSLVDCHY
ncbi:zinc finger protein ZAT5-like [Hibiscus syriacus]|uniref:zinc finger protein ZAT5-like n=1 Tax=Hibiscus syriacus TaxID=106335 RepID=UPI0019225B36|nr:zinc finger protein ZAT5-like [Hibiscus syriacus]